MKIIPYLCFCFIFAGLHSANGQWGISYDKEYAYLGYRWNVSDKKPPTTDGLAEILANRKKDVPLKQISFHTYFLNDPKIQEELMKEFRTSYPELLADALKSSGNLHNPKVLPLRAKFSECLLKTPTLMKMNELFSVTGYRITKAECEKFELNKEKEVPSFECYVWLTLEENADEKLQPSP